MNHPQHKVQDELYDKVIINMKELNENVSKMNLLLADANKINETAVLVEQLDSVYLNNVSFQLDMNKGN